MCVYNEQKLYHTYAPLPGTAIVSRLGPLAAMPNCYLAPLVEKPGCRRIFVEAQLRRFPGKICRKPADFMVKPW